jgi:hypothetical protein
MGYKIAVFRDLGAPSVAADMIILGEYHGYAVSVNVLAHAVLRIDPECQFVVTGGDDVFPSKELPPDEIAAQCTAHFSGTLGIMQPCGDRHMVDEDGRCAAERVTISPWMGREWVKRAYMGKGPLCEAYTHSYVDEDLHNVAERVGLLWHRRDLTQYHDWHGSKGEPEPEHMKRHHGEFETGKRIFLERKAADFPGSEFL